jgi:hypothetical protein
MFLGSYRFVGDPADMIAAYDRLMANFPPDAMFVHVCIVEEDAIVVYDACPTREIFLEFSSGEGFAAAVAAAGLPVPSVQLLGVVHAARVAQAIVPNVS